MKAKIYVEFSSGKSIDESKLHVYVEDKSQTVIRSFEGQQAMAVYDLLTNYGGTCSDEFLRSISHKKERSTPYADIYFREKFIAEVVLFSLRSVLHAKGFISVNDLFRLSPQKIEEWKGPLLGWGTLAGVKVVRSTNGSYYLTLPDPVYPAIEKNKEK